MNRVRSFRAVLLLAALVPTLESCASPARVSRPAAPQPFSATHISATLGQRTFEDDGWEPVEDQLAIGLSLELEPEDSWLSLDVAVHYAEDETSRVVGGFGDVELSAETWEFSLGLLREVGLGGFPLRPYLGAGLSLLLVDADVTDAAGVGLFSGDDATVAPYVRAGLLFEIYEGGQIGIDVRYLGAGEIDIEGRNLDADYTQVTLIFRGVIDLPSTR